MSVDDNDSTLSKDISIPHSSSETQTHRLEKKNSSTQKIVKSNTNNYDIGENESDSLERERLLHNSSMEITINSKSSENKKPCKTNDIMSKQALHIAESEEENNNSVKKINFRRSTRATIPTDRLVINNHSKMYVRESYMDKVCGNDDHSSSSSNDNSISDQDKVKSTLRRQPKGCKAVSIKSSKEKKSCNFPASYEISKDSSNQVEKKIHTKRNAKALSLIIRRSTRAPIPTDRLTINDNAQRYSLESYMQKFYGNDCDDSSCPSIDCDYTCINTNTKTEGKVAEIDKIGFMPKTKPSCLKKKAESKVKDRCPPMSKTKTNRVSLKQPNLNLEALDQKGHQESKTSENKCRRSTRVPVPTDRLTIAKHGVRYLDESYIDKVFNCDDASCSSVDESSDSYKKEDLNANQKASPHTTEDDFFVECTQNNDNSKSASSLNSLEVREFMKREVKPKKNVVLFGIDNDWTKEQIFCLQNAYEAVRPTSTTFWDDIASIMNDKNADECREKWFSLMNLVEEPFATNNNSSVLQKKMPIKDCGSSDNDDIFLSTPFRHGLKSMSSNDSTNETIGAYVGNNLSLEFDAIISSPAMNHLQNRRRSSEGFSPLKTPPTLLKAGYKGYIMKFARSRRGLNALNQRKKKVKRKKKIVSHYVSVDKGDVHMNAMISPGGTLKVIAPTDSDLEDIILDSEEEDSFDECASG